jgi:hypothetical protein
VFLQIPVTMANVHQYGRGLRPVFRQMATLAALELAAEKDRACADSVEA